MSKTPLVDPFAKSPATGGETATTEEAFSKAQASKLNLVPVRVGEFGGRKIEAVADLQQRIVLPVSK